MLYYKYSFSKHYWRNNIVELANSGCNGLHSTMMLYFNLFDFLRRLDVYLGLVYLWLKNQTSFKNHGSSIIFVVVLDFQSAG